MDIDKMTIDELKENLKKCMIQMKQTVETPTHTYLKGKWYFYIIDDINQDIFIYLSSPHVGLNFTLEEADKYLIF